MKDEKKFDAVEMMREIRDRLSELFKDMTYEEQKEFMRKRIKVENLKVEIWQSEAIRQ